MKAEIIELLLKELQTAINTEQKERLELREEAEKGNSDYYTFIKLRESTTEQKGYINGLLKAIEITRGRIK